MLQTDRYFNSCQLPECRPDRPKTHETGIQLGEAPDVGNPGHPAAALPFASKRNSGSGIVNSALPQSQQTTSSGNTHTIGLSIFFSPGKWIAISPWKLTWFPDWQELQGMGRQFVLKGKVFVKSFNTRPQMEIVINVTKGGAPSPEKSCFSECSIGHQVSAQPVSFDSLQNIRLGISSSPTVCAHEASHRAATNKYTATAE
jgi:hypothetical protein